MNDSESETHSPSTMQLARNGGPRISLHIPMDPLHALPGSHSSPESICEFPHSVVEVVDVVVVVVVEVVDSCRVVDVVVVVVCCVNVVTLTMTVSPCMHPASNINVKSARARIRRYWEPGVL